MLEEGRLYPDEVAAMLGGVVSAAAPGAAQASDEEFDRLLELLDLAVRFRVRFTPARGDGDGGGPANRLRRRAGSRARHSGAADGGRRSRRRRRRNVRRPRRRRLADPGVDGDHSGAALRVRRLLSSISRSSRATTCSRAARR